VITGEAGLDAGLYFYHYLSLTVIPMACGAFCLLQRWERPLGSVAFTGTLASWTLGVYLVHPALLDVVTRLGMGPLAFAPVLWIPGLAILVFALAAGIIAVATRIPGVRRTV
jgi:surface polysaccharide O-acyltransferase-like enzyme